MSSSPPTPGPEKKPDPSDSLQWGLLTERQIMQNLAQRLKGHLVRSRFVLYGVALPVLAASFNFITGPLRIIYVLLGFSLIIFFHELGHFLVARMCSVKCLAFSLGIGPRALGGRKGAGLSFGADPFDPEAK